MAGLFAKAAGKKADAPKTAAKKSTVWQVGDPANDPVARSVHELNLLNREAKAIEAKQGVHKNVVKDFANDKYVRDYAVLGVSPETPMVVQNADGEKATFVVQDRSSQYQVKDDQVEALNSLLGEDRTQELLYTETSFGFNRDILAVPGVQEAIEAALEKAIGKLTDDSKGRPVLTAEQAELLLDVKQKTAFKPGTLDRLTVVCGKDTTKIEQFLDIMGSSATRYVKT
jgi:hypothetical protein